MERRSRVGRGSVVAVVALLAAAVPGVARADGPSAPGAAATPPAGTQGGDVVYLKNGGIVRGTLVDAVPERPVRIQLATGEIWSIDRIYIDRVVAASGAEQPGAPVVAPPPPAPAVPSGPMVRLHVESRREVEIVGHPADGSAWVPLCSGACDKPVPAGWEYQVRGTGIKPSGSFFLKPDGSGNATIRVDPGDKSAFDWGLVGVTAGGAVGFVGAIVTSIGANGHYTQTENGVTTDRPVGPSTLPTGVAILCVGAALFVIGGVVALENASTTVSAEPARSSQATASPQHERDVAWAAPRAPDVPTTTLIDLRF